MKKIIEFTWNINYLYLLLQSIFMSTRMEINFSRSDENDENKYENKQIVFDLITECSLSLCIIFYLIGRKINKSKRMTIYTIGKTNNNNLNRYIKDIKLKKKKK